MKILVATTSFPRYPGDNRSPFLLSLAENLVKQGHSVQVAALHVPGVKAEETYSNVKIKRLRYAPERWEVLQETRAGIPGSLQKNKFAIVLLALYILRLSVYILRHAHRFDMIHANWTAAALAAVWTKPLHRKKVVTTLHGSDLRLGSRKGLLSRLTHYVLQHSDKVISVSRYLDNQVAKMGIEDARRVVISNGIDPVNISGEQAQSKQIIYIGSFTENKRVADLLDAFAQLKKRHPDFSLMLVGEGPEERALRAVADKLGLDTAQIFAGVLPHDLALDQIARSFCLVLPSVHEGFGIVLLEAMARGVPCVGAESGSIRELLADGRGVLFEPCNPSALAASIETLITDKELCSSIREAGLRKAANYSWHEIAYQVAAVYREVTGPHAG